MWLVATERVEAGQEIRIDYEDGMEGESYWWGAPPPETGWREHRVPPPPPVPVSAQ